MPLDVRGFDFGQSVSREAQDFSQMLSGSQQVQQRDIALGQQRAQVGREEQVRTALSSAMPQAEKEKLAMSIDPSIANKLLTDAGLDSASKRQEASRFAAKLELLPFNQRNTAINERIQSLESQGRDATQSKELLGMDEETQNQGLLAVQLMDLSTKERFAVKSKAAIAKEKLAGSDEVKSSKILDDGTTIQVLTSGKTRVTSSEGINLSGEDRTQAIIDSEEFGVDIQQRRSKGRELGKGAGKIALTGFETVTKIKENIFDLKRGIDLIEKEGAKTGFVSDFLPSMRASTRKFDNLRRKLGLNVVASVTFGALSEGELNLAMDVALPKGISPEETVIWIKERVAAQEKLADNLEDAALYLADHSVADLIRRNRGMAKAAKKKGTVKAEQPAPQGGIKFLGFE